MKFLSGLAMGLIGYAVWTLSEPAPGQSGDPSARLDRLKEEWQRARQHGKVAGEEKRQEMEREFEGIFRNQSS